MESIHRVENHSMYCLASFLCTRYHGMDYFSTKLYANLVLADPNLHPDAAAIIGAQVELECGAIALRSGIFDSRVNTQCQGPDTSVKDAFLTAATTALHPNPDAKVNLLTLCKAMMGSEALPMMQGGKQLFSNNIHRLVMLLSPGSSPRAHEDPPLPPLSLTGWSLGELS
uniref:Uncharacterized protein n=1 Tax=Oryza rufipogon TaxID=4529 RepID=A0A0E0QZT0_ORYRU